MRQMSSMTNQEFQARGVAQVIVVLKPTAAPKAGAAAAAGTVTAARAGNAPRDLSKHFQKAETAQAAQLVDAAPQRPLSVGARLGRRRAAPPARVPEVRYYPNLGVMLGTTTRDGMAALRRDARVESVSGAPPISLIRPKRKQVAKLTTSLTWGLRMLKVDRLWAQGLSGKGILVGHLDTGADGQHPALRKAIKAFAEFDDLGRQVTPLPKPYDTEDHGTHTAATIAGRPVKGRHIGVAPEARLASAIVIEGGDMVARVLGGMDWAIGQGVRVLSLSLGFQGWWEDFVAITALLRQRGVLPVFAVGNEGPGISRSPGNYSECISVGAHDRDRIVAPFSGSQRFKRKTDGLVPDLVAPGVAVVSAMPGGGYQSMDGSSMATPHVAGLAALLMEAHPERSVDEVETAILESCSRGSTMPQDRANRGIPDGVKALAFLG
jgi:hypothetical protein